jgi:hypothetical protein
MLKPRNLNYDQFADAGPSPTPEDAMKTVVHLADSAAFNFKHGASHLKSAQDEADKLGPAGKNVVWHLDHSIKHHIAAQEDLESLRDHVKAHPAFKEGIDEMAGLTDRMQNWR